MFSIGDDFEVDEDFLDSAFNVESCNNRKNCPSENSSECSTPKELNNLPAAYKKPEASTAEKTNNNDDFINLWNSKEEELFFSKSPEKRLNPRNFLDVARAESPQGLKSEIVTRASRNVVPRKFPGPAGLLPERTCNTSFIAAAEYISKIENEEKPFPVFEGKDVLSQATSNLFEEEEGAWRSMVHDLGTSGSKLISAINLSTIRLKQAKFGFKVPFLAVYVHNIDCSLPDPSLLLKDQKDEMHGTLHREVWEDWKGEIVVGSVLVLQNTGVVTAGMSSRRYFLNITANNITTIYTPKQDTSLKITQIKSVSGLDTSQILEEWERVMNQTRQQQFTSEHSPRPLFTTFSPQPLGFSPRPQGFSPRPQGFSPRSQGFSPRPQGFSARPQGFSPRPQGFSPQSSPPFRSSDSPVSSRPPTPASHQRPQAPMRPVFRPRTPVQQPSYQQESGTHQLPTEIRQQQPFRLPVLSSPSIANLNAIKNCKPQESSSPQSYSSSKPFKMKTEVFKVKANSPQPQVPKPLSSSEREQACLPSKKVKISCKENGPSKATTTSIFSLPSNSNANIVDSLLDGIDTDSFFDDF